MAEASRVERHGFTATELDREKRNLLRVYDQALAENDKDESAPLAAEYIRNFLTDESLPGIAWEHQMHVKFLPGITLAEVNALAKLWNGDHSRVIAVSAPERPGLTIPAEADLARIVKAASSSAVTAYVDSVPDAALIAEPPAPGAIASEKSIPDAGITEWTLSNGARVVLHPTTFKQDEVYFRAISPGGASLVKDADYVAAATAAQVVSAGGLGAFDAVTLDKVLAGKVATVLPFFEESFEGLAGGGSARDLETLLQLVHLRFTKPRADATAFGVMVDQVKSLAANRRSDPDTLFEDTVSAIVWQNHFRKRPLSAEVVQEMSLEKSFAFYKDRFADAGDFVFVFAGSFDPATIRPLVTRYLASLPSTGRKESWKDTAIAPVRGVVEKVVEKGLEPQSRVRIVFSGPFRWDPTQRVLLRVLGLILEGQLGAVLREDQSGTYGVKVTTASDKIPTPSYALSIDFNCAPERTEELVKRLFLEISRIRMDALSESYIRGVREALAREFETDSHENRWAVARITDAYENGDDVKDVLNAPAVNATLSTEMIQEAARLYLDTRNYVRVTLMPEKK